MYDWNFIDNSPRKNNFHRNWCLVSLVKSLNFCFAGYGFLILELFPNDLGGFGYFWVLPFFNYKTIHYPLWYACGLEITVERNITAKTNSLTRTWIGSNHQCTFRREADCVDWRIGIFELMVIAHLFSTRDKLGTLCTRDSLRSNASHYILVAMNAI